MSIKNIDVAKYIGIKHSKVGKDLENGFNCWNFLVYFYNNEFGKDLEYIDGVVNVEAVKGYRTYWVKIKKQKDYAGVLMNNVFTGGLHVGISFDGGILHCVEKYGVVHNKAQPFYLKIKGYYEFREN